MQPEEIHHSQTLWLKPYAPGYLAHGKYVEKMCKLMGNDGTHHICTFLQHICHEQIWCKSNFVR